MEKDLELMKKEAFDNIESHAKKVVQKMLDEKNEAESAKFASTEDFETAKKEWTKQMQELSSDIKKLEQTKKSDVKPVSFAEIISKSVIENAEAIKSFKGGKLDIALKTVADMDLATNFTNHTPFTQQVQDGLISTPHNRVWLADLLPTATSKGNSIIYPKENGGKGSAAVWASGNEKAQVDYKFTSQSAFFKWIAGYVIVENEMLQDVEWLSSYLAAKLLVSLKLAENNFILNGTSDTNPVSGLLDSAQSYDGEFENPVDMVLDALYGQIPQETHEWYLGNNILVAPRTMIQLGLNKATGSGEYDLPGGVVNFGNGNLTIGGVKTTATTGIDEGDFLAFDKDAVMYIRRLLPELRIFEDAELAKENKVMFRIEQRSTLAIFNDDAIVTGEFNKGD